MALAFSDGFSLHDNSSAAALVKSWSMNTSSNINFRQTGRWGGDSYSLYMTPTGASGSYMTQNLSLSGSTTIVGVAVNLSTTPTDNVRILALSNGSSTVALTWAPSSRIAITDGSATTYYTIPSSLAQGTWYYLELKIVWASSGGQIVFRMDTSQYYDSGTTLALGSSTNATSFNLGSTVAGSWSLRTYFTDLVIMDGTGPSLNDFQGDIRIETLLPNANGAHSAWDQTNNTLLTSVNQARFTVDMNGWAVLSGAPSFTRTATGGPKRSIPSYANISGSGARVISTPNGTSGYPVTPGDILRVGAYNRNGFLNVYLRFYDSGGSIVGADLSTGGLNWGSGIWSWQTTGTPVTVPASAATCAIIIEPSSSGSRNFTGVTLTSTDLSNFGYTDPSGDHYFSASDPTYDNDASYVSTNGVGSKDTYGLDNLQSTVGTVLGVRTYTVARKESASVHTIAPVVRVGGTDYPGAAVNLPDNLTYLATNDFRPISPASGAAWTRSEVNSMEAGLELSS